MIFGIFFPGKIRALSPGGYTLWNNQGWLGCIRSNFSIPFLNISFAAADHFFASAFFFISFISSSLLSPPSSSLILFICCCRKYSRCCLSSSVLVFVVTLFLILQTAILFVKTASVNLPFVVLHLISVSVVFLLYLYSGCLIQNG